MLSSPKPRRMPSPRGRPPIAKLKLTISWQYVKRVPSYNGGSTTAGCDIGDDALCVPTTRLYASPSRRTEYLITEHPSRGRETGRTGCPLLQ